MLRNQTNPSASTNARPPSPELPTRPLLSVRPVLYYKMHILRITSVRCRGKRKNVSWFGFAAQGEGGVGGGVCVPSFLWSSVPSHDHCTAPARIDGVDFGRSEGCGGCLFVWLLARPPLTPSRRPWLSLSSGKSPSPSSPARCSPSGRARASTSPCPTRRRTACSSAGPRGRAWGRR